MSKREIVAWSCDPDGERLDHDSMDEAVASYLDDIEPANWPETLEVYGYARMEITLPNGSALESLLEYLDEEYSDPDDEAAGPTAKMAEAERAFLDVVQAEYEPWACEKVDTITVNVQDWVKANRPDWLVSDAQA